MPPREKRTDREKTAIRRLFEEKRVLVPKKLRACKSFSPLCAVMAFLTRENIKDF